MSDLLSDEYREYRRQQCIKAYRKMLMLGEQMLRTGNSAVLREAFQRASRNAERLYNEFVRDYGVPPMMNVSFR